MCREVLSHGFFTLTNVYVISSYSQQLLSLKLQFYFLQMSFTVERQRSDQIEEPKNMIF